MIRQIVSHFEFFPQINLLSAKAKQNWLRSTEEKVEQKITGLKQ